MDEVTQQNAALVEEAAAAAESMQDQAHELTQAVGTFKLASASSNITAAPVKRSNRPSTVTKLPNRGPATKKTVVNSSANSTSAPAQPRKAAAGGGSNDWEEF